MNPAVTVEAAAPATGQPVRRVRAWCATGKLNCQMNGDGSALPVAGRDKVGWLSARREAFLAAGLPEASGD